MDFGSLIESAGLLWSPLFFAVLVGVATLLFWMVIIPARALGSMSGRLSDYVESDRVDELEMRRPFVGRALVPGVRKVLSALARVVPLADVENTRRLLIQAGEPWGMAALDFLGLRVLSLIVLGGGYFLLASDAMAFTLALRNALLLGALGFFLPALWLRQRVRSRKHEIARALPDALDMLSVGVEAGLAFESALLRVADQWDNALTEEFRRAVREMRLGAGREEALRRMAERTGVEDLSTFVAVLVQSTRLGVSIAQVLEAQAAQMRLKRRQLAEEQARKAGIKMIFPLVFLIFPAMFVVILGPSMPALLNFLGDFAGVSVGVP
ncbi:MAG: type II secretion system F family protein [Anaerolineae bacterium]